jgi:hypothetical protein
MHKTLCERMVAGTGIYAPCRRYVLFIEQARVCASANDNMHEQLSANAKTMFLNNEFPEAIIEGPPNNASTPQPESKEQLMNALINLKHEIQKAEELISTSRFNGKTKHHGLKYFNAHEWLRFADMHIRHHLRQKKRIDDFLKMAAI